MQGKTRTLIGSGVMALGALVALGPRYLLPVCEYHQTETAATGGSMGAMDGMSGSMEGMSHGSMEGMAMSGTAAPAATDHMACFYTARAALIIGIIIGIIGLAIILANKVSIRRINAALLAVSGLAVVLTPLYLYPTCENQEMFCNQGAKQLLIVLGGTTILSAAWLAFSPERKTDNVAQSALETS